MDKLDQQGNAVRVGVAYQFVFAMPGPCITCLVVESDNNDGTFDCYDVYLKRPVLKVRANKLWRPLGETWAGFTGDVAAVTSYAGAQALDLT